MNATATLPTNPQILAVEDELADVEILRTSLASISRKVRLAHAANGRDALASLRSSEVKPNLILLDLNMPIMDGLETLAELKQDELLRGIPVIVFTSSDRSEDVLASYKRFANCYVQKPLGLKESRKTLRAICDFWFETAKPSPGAPS